MTLRRGEAVGVTDKEVAPRGRSEAGRVGSSPAEWPERAAAACSLSEPRSFGLNPPGGRAAGAPADPPPPPSLEATAAAAHTPLRTPDPLVR